MSAGPKRRSHDHRGLRRHLPANEPLATLLESILVAADAVADLAAVGMIVVDDNPDGAAKAVVDRFEGRFELGIHYRHVGLGNIYRAQHRPRCRHRAGRVGGDDR